ncbi:MAG: carboxypeptidase-like regulatory domain-containing protein, partial [Prevotellaceae bacterium]|nr:carboxypeptidase-like regulatory domain-containing protein [Prevotellaceae bacterium]
MAYMRNLFMNICLIVGCLLATATPAMAQRLVTGMVTDDGKAPLPGATVTVKERPAIGTTTDQRGHFRLKLPDDGEAYTLQVSHVGYETRIRKVRPGEKET